MTIFTKASALAIAAGLAWIAPAAAQSIPFNGTRENVNPLLPPGSGRCAPQRFNTVVITPGQISSTGTSNFGSFTSTQSHCVDSPPPTALTDGRFTYTFQGGDTIFGTYNGNAANSATPGVFNAVENLTITGGTGRFVGASGSITSNGQLRVVDGNGVFMGTLTGNVTATTTTSSGEFSTALGTPSAATGRLSTALGAFSLASGERSLAVGSFSEAIASDATAVGNDTFASAPGSSAFGQGAVATAPAASAIGHNTVASGLASFAGGVRAQATTEGAVALGRFAAATAASTVSVGAGSAASADLSTAVGERAQATGLAASAFGQQARATAMGATAIGRFSEASQMGTTALGVRSTASAVNAIAIGPISTASAERAVSIGAGATAAFVRSTAIGAGAATTADNQVALGGAGSAVRVGDIAASTAAQTGPVGLATVDANGVLGQNTGLIPAVADCRRRRPRSPARSTPCSTCAASIVATRARASPPRSRSATRRCRPGPGGRPMC
jgi:hypothetical protein